MKISRYLIIALLSSFSLTLLAQERTMTLQKCINLALESNLRMKADEVAISKARELQGTAFDMEMTSLSLSQDPTSGGSPDNGITISQSLDFPTVYKARKNFLKAETTVAQGKLRVTRNEVIRDVTSSYYKLLYIHRALEILQAQDSVYRKFVNFAKVKCNVGETGNLELMNAERLYNENLIDMRKVVNAYHSAKLYMKQLIGVDVLITPAETSLPIMQAEWGSAAVNFEQTPIGSMYAAQADASQCNLKLVKQGYMPKFNVGFTSQLLLKGFNPYNVDRSRFSKGNFMGFEVGISVPLFWGGQKAKVKAAKREVELASISQQWAKQRMDTEYRDCFNELLRAQEALNYFNVQGNRQAERMSQLSQISYENGEIGYVEYVQNQKTALDVQLQYAGAINDFNQAVIKMNYIKGNK